MNEGSPRVVLELLGCGIPIIASQHPGIIELDKSRLYINFISSFNTIEKYISDFRKDPNIFYKKSSLGRLYSINNYSDLIISNQYSILYESLI